MPLPAFRHVPTLLLAAACGTVTAADAPAKRAAPASTPPCQPDAAWTQPGPPRRVFGNTWFVGSCGLSAILVTSPQGHVLIDGTVDDNVPLIEANIRALGFRLDDVHILVGSHEHGDHAGGLARLQHDTHATVWARGPAAAALERGKGDRSDPQFDTAKPYAAVANVRRLDDGGTVRAGATVLTAHATPGHTPGSTSWTWRSCEGTRCLDIVYADSLTPISDDHWRFGDEAAHPGVVAAFRHSIATVAALPCDILLTPHPDASDLWLRLGDAPSAALVDAGACARYAAGASAALDARLAKEASSGGKSP